MAPELWRKYAMPYDFNVLLDLNTAPPWSSNDVAEEAAWAVIERFGWAPVPALLFALKQQILEQMAGG